MRTYNAGLTAANEVSQRTKDAGVASDYVRMCLTLENSGNIPAIMERVRIIENLEREKEGE